MKEPSSVPSTPSGTPRKRRQGESAITPSKKTSGNGPGNEDKVVQSGSAVTPSKASGTGPSGENEVVPIPGPNFNPEIETEDLSMTPVDTPSKPRSSNRTSNRGSGRT
jgi:hypothetical protein